MLETKNANNDKAFKVKKLKLYKIGMDKACVFTPFARGSDEDM